MIALPALESFGFRRFASAASTAPIAPSKRCVFQHCLGVTKETRFPDQATTGSEYQLRGPLAADRHQSDITVVQGCSNQFSNEAHWEEIFWLTGANRYSVAGQNMSNSISADQVVARNLGQDTRFSSIQLNGSSLKDTVPVSPWHGINEVNRSPSRRPGSGFS